MTYSLLLLTVISISFFYLSFFYISDSDDILILMFIKCNKSSSAFNASGSCWNRWLNLRRPIIKLLIK